MRDSGNNGSTKLPKSYVSSIVEYVDERTLLQLVRNGLLIYFTVVLISTIAQILCIHAFNCQVIKENGICVTNILDLLYFNLITILTIGYGDYAPYGIGRIIACAEALAGVGIFGAVVSAAVLKMMLPKRNSIVFSKYCYFTLDDMRFVIVFVNTTKLDLVNADMCSILKLGRINWIVRPPYRAPYVGESAWTFSVNSLLEYISKDPKEEITRDDVVTLLSEMTLYEDDGLKFGISGSLGFSRFSASKKYSPNQCWVLKTKHELSVDILRKPQFGSREFEDAFHYIPPGRKTFLDWAKEYGAIEEGN